MNFEHLENDDFPILVDPSAMTTLSILDTKNTSLKLIYPGTVACLSPLQFSKALFPILVTLLGILIEVSPVQLRKALIPILVTLLGILIEVSPSQAEKALFSILVTL